VAFLLDLAARQHANSTVNIPMSRQEIADYLGVTIETVSRTLTQLEACDTIALPTARTVKLRNRAALAKLDA
jgi:CRP/FNR family nitrogen fixation transcriptional regulator